MALVETTITLTSASWTEIAPNIISSSLTFINVSEDEGVVFWRVASGLPDVSELYGKPLNAYEGFLKRELADMTYATANLKVYARPKGQNGTLYVEFEDSN